MNIHGPDSAPTPKTACLRARQRPHEAHVETAERSSFHDMPEAEGARRKAEGGTVAATGTIGSRFPDSISPSAFGLPP
jgi:hypothetical protein